MLLRIFLNVLPATTEIGIVVLAEDAEQDGTAQFGNGFTSPVLTQFFQFAVSVVGGMDQFMGPGRKVLHTDRDGQTARPALLKPASVAAQSTVERLHRDVPAFCNIE